MKSYLENIYNNAVILNEKNILSLVDKKQDPFFVDLGCGDGDLTLKIANKLDTKNIFGVEIFDKNIKEATNKGIKVKKFNLNQKFDFKNNYFDVVIANQVIEHIYNSDNFIYEIYRILKPKGYAIISTENASSWCNIVASIMGWQIFSLTSFSHKKLGIGNPLALYRNKKGFYDTHMRIYNIRGLKEYFEVFGFKVEKIKGSDYFPLPAIFGNFDKIHCHFMTFKIRK